MKTRICKSFKFSAAHYLENKNLTKEQNAQLFGKCSGVRTDSECNFPHGHTYQLDVTVEGTINDQDGMLINFNDLKGIVNRTIIDLYDHKCINLEIPIFAQGVIPTAENMANIIFSILAKELSFLHRKLKLVSIKLWEGPESWAEVICD